MYDFDYFVISLISEDDIIQAIIILTINEEEFAYHLLRIMFKGIIIPIILEEDSIIYHLVHFDIMAIIIQEVDSITIIIPIIQQEGSITYHLVLID